MFIRHPGRFNSSLDKVLYSFLTSRRFAEMCGVTTKAVMAWRDRRKSIPQKLLHQVAYELHLVIEQRCIPQPRCITKLNKLMGYTSKAA